MPLGIDTYTAFGIATVASPTYAALGDSYASGEGSFSYLTGSDTKNDRCHRATNGYAVQAAAASRASLRFVACSGAVIKDFSSKNHLWRSEAAQLSAVQGAQRVTVSVGGNDVGFEYVLRDCVYGSGPGSPGCATRDTALFLQALGWLKSGVPSGCYTLPGINPDGPQPPQVCGPVQSLSSLYQQILARAAPGSEVLVVGYPHLFGNFASPQCRVGSALAIRLNVSSSDATWMNAAADLLDERIASSVEAVAASTHANIRFVDPRATFSGHGLCDTDVPYINGLKLKLASPRPESFHPNSGGQNALASLIEATM
jgi:hypothetical protein